MMPIKSVHDILIYKVAIIFQRRNFKPLLWLILELTIKNLFKMIKTLITYFLHL